ncbi:hypothetical protein BV898_00157 [Hypsibius exemplaris]|uniref:Uncharacterized protein n=1 Tax=Hypsibius exemplaris TaxID=2072580 RepID=A0A1W0XEZ1_HYPEX|nr:hypothetical protein BV898_00157 [Hypsibius exemplaris]
MNALLTNSEWAYYLLLIYKNFRTTRELIHQLNDFFSVIVLANLVRFLLDNVSFMAADETLRNVIYVNARIMFVNAVNWFAVLLYCYGQSIDLLLTYGLLFYQTRDAKGGINTIMTTTELHADLDYLTGDYRDIIART